MNNVTIFVDKVAGEVLTSAKGTKYLKNGVATVTLPGKDKKETFRLSWLRVTDDMLNRGMTLNLNIEVTKRDDKTYSSLVVNSAVPAFSSENSGYLVGKIVEIRPYQKMITVSLEIEYTNFKGEVTKGIQKVKVFDKDSSLGKTMQDNRGNTVFCKVELSPSNGYVEFTAKSATVVAAQGADGTAFEGVADIDGPAPVEDLPF